MTLTDLYRKALEKLQVVAAGEPVEPADHQLVAAKYLGVYELLLGKRLVAWGVDEDIPEFASIPLVSILAYATAGEFGIDPSRFATEGALDLPVPSLGERQLRAQIVKDYVSYPAESLYF